MSLALIMKKNLRFYLALYFSKSTARFMKLLGKKATSMPGSWALIICPDFLDRIDKPEKIYGITGTNGKTTVTNMIIDILENLGADFVCNREGSNVPTGIATVLIKNSTLTGKMKKNMAVFELDERSAARMFPYLKIDTLLVINLFRDSFKRNAHVEYIYNILNSTISPDIKLIVNGDDPMCVKLGTQEKLYYGMLPQEFESGEFINIVRDGAVCPNCSAPLTYDFTRYNHVGIYHCDNCGYFPAKQDFVAVKADLKNRTLDTVIKGSPYTFRLVDENPHNIYNELSAISYVHEMGYSLDEIDKAINNLKVAESRLISTEVNGKTVARIIAKGQNPVASSRSFESVKTFNGKKCLVLILDDHEDAGKSVENISWYFDTDFEFLNDPSVNQVIVEGTRNLDVLVRLLMAGMDRDIIKCVRGTEKIKDTIDYEISDTFIVYHHTHRYYTSEPVRVDIIEKIKEMK
ncbi:MAG: MurT ligase domain-containing protein [Clostridia bacterium]